MRNKNTAKAVGDVPRTKNSASKQYQSKNDGRQPIADEINIEIAESNDIINIYVSGGSSNNSYSSDARQGDEASNSQHDVFDNGPAGQQTYQSGEKPPQLDQNPPQGQAHQHAGPLITACQGNPRIEQFYTSMQSLQETNFDPTRIRDLVKQLYADKQYALVFMLLNHKLYKSEGTDPPGQFAQLVLSTFSELISAEKNDKVVQEIQSLDYGGQITFAKGSRECSADVSRHTQCCSPINPFVPYFRAFQEGQLDFDEFYERLGRSPLELLKVCLSYDAPGIFADQLCRVDVKPADVNAVLDFLLCSVLGPLTEAERTAVRLYAQQGNGIADIVRLLPHRGADLAGIRALVQAGSQ